MKIAFAYFLRTVLWIGALTFLSNASPAASLQLGDEPKLVVTDFSGKTFDLHEQRGKWVMVHFFASWCPGCKTELPEIVKLYADDHAKGLEMIALSPEPYRKKSDAFNFMKPYPIPSAILADANVNDFGAAVSLPTTYLIDRSGKIKLIFGPDEKVKSLDRAKIESLISQK